MLKSMTGFGRSTTSVPMGRCMTEVQSLNRKYLEVFVFLPRELSRFEIDIRKRVAERISRGQLTVRINVYPDAENFVTLLPEYSLLKNMKDTWVKLTEKLKLDPDQINLSFLAEQVRYLPKSDRIENEEKYRKVLIQSVDIALDELIKMKKKEGGALSKDIEKRLTILEKDLVHIEKKAPDASLRFKQKLQEKIEEFSTTVSDNEDRILREIAIFSEKIDITEEITRFRSHIAQFRSVMGLDISVGRKMDFIMQELGREINTIGEKSQEVTISKKVVDVKSELEKIREQVQNIE